MSLATVFGIPTKANKTIFELMGLSKSNLEIKKTRNRRLVVSGTFSAPIVDNHLIVHDESGNMVAICVKDLKRILEEVS